MSPLILANSSINGWGVPTATDIAFALGCLALLGNRIPFGLKVFLTAVAIVDDLIAVLVIAIFYSSDLNYTMLAIGFSVLLLLIFANLYGIRQPLVYGSLGVVVWLTFLNSGVHASIAGVLVAITIPRAAASMGQPFWRRYATSSNNLRSVRVAASQSKTLNCRRARFLKLRISASKYRRLCKSWNICSTLGSPFSSCRSLPLPTPGSRISLSTMHRENLPIMLGIIVGLTVGKPIGIFCAVGCRCAQASPPCLKVLAGVR